MPLGTGSVSNSVLNRFIEDIYAMQGQSPVPWYSAINLFKASGILSAEDPPWQLLKGKTPLPYSRPRRNTGALHDLTTCYEA